MTDTSASQKYLLNREPPNPSPRIEHFSRECRHEARRLYPNEHDSKALELFAQNNRGKFKNRFFWKNNQRHIWDSDICYCDTEQPPFQVVSVGGTKYLVNLSNPRSLKQIDGPKRTARLVAHRSEGEWALPQGHSRHLLSFPQEILDAIFNFALVDRDNTISPDVTTTNNAKMHKAQQLYTLNGARYRPNWYPYRPRFRNLVPLSTIITKQLHDEQGDYFIHRVVYRPRIDATLLRVCKGFRTQATKILYGENVFQFSMTDLGFDGFPGVCIWGGKGRAVKSEPQEHYQARVDSLDKSQESIEDFILAIQKQTPVMDLANHIYHDHFIRFLHAIGSENAAMIKTLHFRGDIITHNCGGARHCEPDCEEDLFESLLLYIPLINKFCTSLQTLIVGIGEDQLYLMDYSPRGAYDIAKKKLEVLDRNLRKLETVRRIEIYRQKKPEFVPLDDSEKEDVQFWSGKFRNEVMGLKNRADHWFKERV